MDQEQSPQNDSVPPQPPTAPDAPVNAPTNGTYIAASQLQSEQKRLPTGVYIIAGFTLLGFVLGFFDTSQNSLVYVFAMFLNLLLAIGLFLRMEVARKLMMWLSGILLVLSVAGVLMLGLLQQKIAQNKTAYETALRKIDQTRLTATQKQQIENVRTVIATQEKRAGKAINFTYAKLGATALEAVVVMVYLTRPKVKSVFRELEP